MTGQPWQSSQPDVRMVDATSTQQFLDLVSRGPVPIADTGLVAYSLPEPNEITKAGIVGRRIVRHGLREVLEWLGEEVGPSPDEPIERMLICAPSAPALISVEPMGLTEYESEVLADRWVFRSEERLLLTVVREGYPKITPLLD